MPLRPLSCALVLLAVALHAQQTPIRIPANQARGVTGVGTNLSAKAQAAVHAEAAAAALNTTSTVTIKSLAHWNSSFKYAATGTLYPLTMVGTNPVKNPTTTTIPVVLIPLKFVFDDYLVNGQPLVLAPAAKIPLLEASPIFATHDYGFGAAQYLDALQRDTFNVSNDYHVLLGTPKVRAGYVVHVSSSNSQVYQIGTGYVGVVDINFLYNLISTLPQQLGILPNQLAMMFSYDVYGAPLPNPNFFYYGYHGNTQVSTTSTSTTVQVWAWSSWIDPGFFYNTHTLDITGMTHEIAELANDPFLNNNAPSYRYPYDATSCNELIEVGDIAEGMTADSFATRANNYTYHPANVAMLPWFERTTATTTTGVYSFPGTLLLTTPSKPCL